MHKKLIRLFSVFLLLIMTFMLSSFTVSAAAPEYEIEERALARRYISPTPVQNKNAASYNSLSLYINGRLASYNGKLIGGEVYLPIIKLAESLTDAKVNYTSSTKTVTVFGSGHSISVSDGAYVLYASDRPLFSLTPSVLLSDGIMYVPAQSILKALGMSGSYNSTARKVTLSGTATPLRSASKFYREDEVYWLSRIINAESRGESLLGQIAVGGVVLNRVRSPLYPNTIWGVIFDKKYGVQFSPVLDGSIYATPAYTATLAAKICLEGYTLSDEILFFVNPRYATSSWISKARPFAFRIGGHWFYK
jgi:N-acetylmuramoyl-L-alanine amidase